MSKTAVAVTLAGAALVVSPSIGAASPDSIAVEKAIRALNAGKQAPADCKPAAAIIDEFAPFSWDSFATWTDALGKYNAQNAITDSKISSPKFRHVNVEGTRAYAVVSVRFTYKQSGHARSELATETWALEKGASGWCSKSFAWFSKAGVDGGADATAVGNAVAAFASMKPGDAPPPTAITDEFSPYLWQGASAAADWGAGLQKSMTADHDTGLTLGLSDPSHLSVNGDKAYAVYPTTLTYSHKGEPMKEPGAFAFVLDKSSGTWRITSWAWATQ